MMFPGRIPSPVYPTQPSGVQPGFGANPPRAIFPHPVTPEPIGGPARPVLGGFKKGGKVPKTGKYLLHKGEHVVKAGSRKMTNRKPQKMVSVGELKA